MSKITGKASTLCFEGCHWTYINTCIQIANNVSPDNRTSIAWCYNPYHRLINICSYEYPNRISWQRIEASYTAEIIKLQLLPSCVLCCVYNILARPLQLRPSAMYIICLYDTYKPSKRYVLIYGGNKNKIRSFGFVDCTRLSLAIPRGSLAFNVYFSVPISLNEMLCACI